jgi:hypothetical protein
MHDIEYLQKLQTSQALKDIEWELCANPDTGLYYWLTHWARTLDSHDSENILKPFPDKEYLKLFTDLWLKEPLILIPKSRQMMLSWVVVGSYLWDTRFKKGRLNFFQSKREEDADDLVRRAKHIWDNEPKFLKRYRDFSGFHELRCNPQNKGNHTYCRLAFPDTYSEIRGIPQGGDIIRMHTASGIFSDEMAFQPEAQSAYTAAKPTLSANGRWTGVSTAEDDSFFQAMCFDEILI